VSEILNIELANGNPSMVTLKMSIEDLAFVACLIGKTSPALKTAWGIKWEIGGDLWNVIVGDCINRFYDGGTDDLINLPKEIYLPLHLPTTEEPTS